MLSKILALFGLAPSDVQRSTPPLFAYLAVVAAGYYSAVVIEGLTALVSLFGEVARYYLSVSLRTIGVVASLFLAHGVYRAVIHNDDYSWGGFIRNLLRR